MRSALEHIEQLLGIDLFLTWEEREKDFWVCNYRNYVLRVMTQSESHDLPVVWHVAFYNSQKVEDFGRCKSLHEGRQAAHAYLRKVFR